MSTHPLDDPAILSRLFYPRAARPGYSMIASAHDGTIAVDDGVVLGFRLYVPENPRSVILFFHGNGEVAADYDPIAKAYFTIDTALLVVDYRGYGWSTGTPLASTLLSDAEAVLPALPDILKSNNLDSLPLLVMGRSLGSAPAIHVAYTAPERFKGLIIDSGFADMPSVFRGLSIPIDLTTITDLPVGNAKRMESITLPLLVIHGERDTLLPIRNGEQLFRASPSVKKTFLPIPGAGHNDLMSRGLHVYFGALAKFLHVCSAAE